jgi:hypothetical protein
MVRSELPGWQPRETTVTRSLSGWVWGTVFRAGTAQTAADDLVDTFTHGCTLCLGNRMRFLMGLRKRLDRARRRMKTLRLERWQKVPFWRRGAPEVKDVA